MHERELRALHSAVRNAGISGTRVPLAEQSLESWHTTIEAKLISIFYAMKDQIPALLKNESSVIVNLASVLAFAETQGISDLLVGKPTVEFETQGVFEFAHIDP